MNTTITLKQLRNDMPAVIEAVGKGKAFTVIKRSRPVFEIAPPKDDGWEIDFTDAEHPNGIPADVLLEMMKKVREEEDGR